jgi:superfamily II DNA or RNA helicase
MIYESISSENFYTSLSNKKEFRKPYPKEYLREHQRFLTNFINPLTTYNSILVAHQPGLGKTLTSISIAENFKDKFNISIFTKNNIIESNFKKELINFYLTDSEKAVYYKTAIITDYYLIDAKKEINDRILKEITKNYSFYTYSAFSSSKKLSLSNNIIVIDEVHNITNNDMYYGLMDTLNNSNNFKLVLLSATPMFDNISEIFEISNILNASSKIFLPIRNDLINNELVVKADNILNITKTGELLLRDTLRGKVSFLISGKDNFPEKIFKGQKLIGGSLKVFKSEMSNIQENVYKNVVNSDIKDTLFKNASDISTIIYPDSSYGKNGFLKYKNRPDEVFKLSKLNTFSPKLYSIMTDIVSNPGKIFVYSNYVNNGGTELVSAVLAANGFSRYLSRNTTNKHYIVLGESTGSKERKKLLTVFNSKENKNGDLIKVIVGSPVLSEGVSFKSIRRIHILEPHWNLSRIDQIIGRGVRLMSHSELPVKDRNVSIFLHCSVIKTGKLESIDIMKYTLSEKKDISISKVIRIIKEIAIDCSFNKSKNNIFTEPFSRECDYSKCLFICQDTNNDNNIVDKSTYDFRKHSPIEYKRIQTDIEKIFKNGFMFDFDYIQNIINSEFTKQVLEEYIFKKKTMYNNNNDPGILKKTDKFYYIQPNDISVDTYDFFYKMFKRKNKRIPFNVKKEIKKQNTVSIAGEYRNKIFYILTTNSDSEATDKRLLNTGRRCDTYNKKEIKNFFTILGKRPEANTKEELCKKLESLLTTKK